jgi:hypothetical protein
MSNYLLPYFGELDLKNLEEYYDVDIDFNGQKIQIDLNFESTSIEPKRLDVVKQFIENIANYNKRNKQYIDEDYKDEDCDTVRTYVEHHLEDIDKDELTGLVDFNNKTTSAEIQLKNALKLVRLGIYPHNEKQFAIFDYSIDQDLTQYLVVINTDENGNLDYMTMES